MSFDLRREFLLLRSLNALNHPSAARGEGVALRGYGAPPEVQLQNHQNCSPGSKILPLFLGPSQSDFCSKQAEGIVSEPGLPGESVGLLGAGRLMEAPHGSLKVRYDDSGPMPGPGLLSAVVSAVTAMGQKLTHSGRSVLGTTEECINM
ncbi:hypothetical protein CB1_001179041 [Camelus ferus]|nr:hypothetical protein CB1_001179041 [Camelus ferus]